MDALWWFYTVVLGAAFAQIAMAIAIHWRTAASTGTRIHLPSLLWLIFLLVLVVEVWIAVGTYQRTVTSMSILSLLAFLWVPMGIFLLAVFLSDPPSPDAEDQGQSRFERLRRSFFIVLLLIPAVNLAHEAILGSLGFDADSLFPVLLAIGALAGFFIRSRRADIVLASVMIALIAVYLVSSYGTVSVPGVS